MNKHKRLSDVDEVKVIKVVRVKSIRGRGTEESPVEQITEYFSLKGKRLARVSFMDKVDNIHEWKD